ncbi:hypothetical protein HDU96_002329 [Phlyctochytrium bullatum]|nr:hypothetical protein HDU96_002329 [Phlyctochytrium bullatum]
MGKLKKALRQLQQQKKSKKASQVAAADDGDGDEVLRQKVPQGGGKIDKKKKLSGTRDLSKIPHQHKALSLFSGDDRVLLVGPKLVVATCFDSEEVVKQKYEESPENVEAIKSFDGQVLYGVDATMLGKHRPLKKTKFSKIVFNFPHVGKGIKDQVRNIKANQDLCSGFFRSAMEFLADKGEILLTIRSGEPYDSWGVKQLAKREGLATKVTTVFDPSEFPGYAHRRTIGFDERISTDCNEDILRSRCSTFVFVTKKTAEQLFKNKKSGTKGDDSD